MKGDKLPHQKRFTSHAYCQKETVASRKQKHTGSEAYTRQYKDITSEYVANLGTSHQQFLVKTRMQRLLENAQRRFYKIVSEIAPVEDPESYKYIWLTKLEDRKNQWNAIVGKYSGTIADRKTKGWKDMTPFKNNVPLLMNLIASLPAENIKRAYRKSGNFMRDTSLPEFIKHLKKEARVHNIPVMQNRERKKFIADYALNRKVPNLPSQIYFPALTAELNLGGNNGGETYRENHNIDASSTTLNIDHLNLAREKECKVRVQLISEEVLPGVELNWGEIPPANSRNVERGSSGRNSLAVGLT